MAEATVRRTKEEVLQGINNQIMCAYQEVILLAALYNQAREENEIDELYVKPPVHLLVKAFAIALGNAFKACTGQVAFVSDDTTSQYGLSAKLRFDINKREVQVKTWQVDHAWLEVPLLDMWIDVMVPGSYLWVSPVLYMPGKFRPPYCKKMVVIDPKFETRISEVNEFAEILKKLLKEKGPNC